MDKFKEWIKAEAGYNELNFKDGGDFKHSMAAILASMGSGLVGGALGGIPGALAGGWAGKEAMSRLYPATGKDMKKMKRMKN